MTEENEMSPGVLIVIGIIVSLVIAAFINPMIIVYVVCGLIGLVFLYCLFAAPPRERQFNEYPQEYRNEYCRLEARNDHDSRKWRF